MPALLVEFGPKTRALLERIDETLKQLVDVTGKATDQSTFSGGFLMFIVKDDHADVAYSITPPDATDAEGNPIPGAALSFEVSSSDDAVVSITPGADPASGSVHFGSPGQAAINVNVKTGDTLLGAFGAQFTVTVGDPAAIAGGSIAFDGLIES